MDGGTEFVCASPLDYTPALTDGSHTFTVYAITAGGIPDPFPASYTWTLDATPPNTSITGRPDKYSNNRTPLFTFTGSDGTGTGVDFYQCKLDEGSYSTCTGSYTSLNLDDGVHHFYVRAVDNAGNTDPTPDFYDWEVDATLPETFIDSNPLNPSNDTSPTFTFHGTDGFGSGVVRYECKIDSGSFNVCTSGVPWIGIGNGSHTLLVRAVDRAGSLSGWAGCNRQGSGELRRTCRRFGQDARRPHIPESVGSEPLAACAVRREPGRAGWCLHGLPSRGLVLTPRRKGENRPLWSAVSPSFHNLIRDTMQDG